MEGQSKDPVGFKESLLNSITMVDVDVNVQNPRMIFQQLENSDHDVVHVAEPACFILLGMVETSTPVDGNVCLLCYLR